MAAKNKVETPATASNVNNNNNVNNINVNVKLDHPKTYSSSKGNDKPNWIKKAIVLGVITLTLSLIGYFIKQYHEDGNSKSNPTMQLKNAP